MADPQQNPGLNAVDDEAFIDPAELREGRLQNVMIAVFGLLVLTFLTFAFLMIRAWYGKSTIASQLDRAAALAEDDVDKPADQVVRDMKERLKISETLLATDLEPEDAFTAKVIQIDSLGMLSGLNIEEGSGNNRWFKRFNEVLDESLQSDDPRISKKVMVTNLKLLTKLTCESEHDPESDSQPFQELQSFVVLITDKYPDYVLLADEINLSVAALVSSGKEDEAGIVREIAIKQFRESSNPTVKSIGEKFELSFLGDVNEADLYARLARQEETAVRETLELIERLINDENTGSVVMERVIFLAEAFLTVPDFQEHAASCAAKIRTAMTTINVDARSPAMAPLESFEVHIEMIGKPVRIEGETPSGKPVTPEKFKGKHTLLVFGLADEGLEALLSKVEQFRYSDSSELAVVLVLAGTPQSVYTVENAAMFKFATVIAPTSESFPELNLSFLPYFVLLDEEAKVMRMNIHPDEVHVLFTLIEGL